MVSLLPYCLGLAAESILAGQYWIKESEMEGESPTQASPAAGAVFLSYANQDAEAAKRICEALRAAGIEVWFDQSELRGGEVWDQRIRREIRDCALFVPIISAHSDARHEGYFRREWRLAVERAGDMSERFAYLVPVVIDDTSESRADVPERFREVQWTRLPAGEGAAAFVARVQRLLSPEPSTMIHAPASVQAGAPGVIWVAAREPGWPKRVLPAAVAIAAVGAVAWFAIDKPWTSKPTVSSSTVAASAAPPAFRPPPHSVAVLPFVNMSGDKDQEYFSQGLTEELLNSLTEINGLQVAGRTSAFSFQGKDTDAGTIARKLNVGAILEGSVRRSGHTVRITAQLLNAVTGFHLWSKTYDRDLGDVLKLQTEIAVAVADALKVTLLGNEAARIELGGTRNPAAFDAYLRGSKAARAGEGASSYQSAIAEFTEAIGLDPNYALAFASRSLALSYYASDAVNAADSRKFAVRSEVDARRALRLAPDLAEGHLALARSVVATHLDFTQASEAYQRAMAFAPGDAGVLALSGLFAVSMGRSDVGIAAARHAVALDPLNPQSHEALGEALFWARRYQEAVAAFAEVISLEPDFKRAYGFRGVAWYWLGELHSARSSCETKPDHWSSMWCLALTYEKLGWHGEAQAEQKKLQAVFGDNSAYQLATIYAAWGDTDKALEWLTRAVRLPDAGVTYLKIDALVDPMRHEPRFQAIERALKFPG
ncbi:MAG: TIR domain-containing protein [Proteobacteria bacterium]|nr:TIR domain-containing protein [Pseudomonadota bacterium]